MYKTLSSSNKDSGFHAVILGSTKRQDIGSVSPKSTSTPAEFIFDDRPQTTTTTSTAVTGPSKAELQTFTKKKIKINMVC